MAMLLGKFIGELALSPFKPPVSYWYASNIQARISHDLEKVVLWSIMPGKNIKSNYSVRIKIKNFSTNLTQKVGNLQKKFSKLCSFTLPTFLLQKYRHLLLYGHVYTCSEFAVCLTGMWIHLILVKGIFLFFRAMEWSVIV